MKPINFIVKDGALVPERLEDSETFNERFGEGELIETELRPVASPGQRRFWAMINAAFDYYGRPRWDSAEMMGDAVKLAVQWRDLGEAVAGSPYWKSRSLAAVKDWPGFLRQVHSLLVNTLNVPADLLAVPEDRNDEGRPDPTRGDEPGDDLAHGVIVSEISSRPSPRECMDKFMLFAQNREAWGDNSKGQLEMVGKLESQWKEAMPDQADFVTRCANAAKMVVAGSVPSGAMRKMLAEQLPK
jgi:hypothetical protein